MRDPQRRPTRKLFACYVPTLDRRWVEQGRAPFVKRLLRSSPSVSIRTLPCTELVPTMITGAWPHEHGVWQVRLRDTVPDTWRHRLLERLPDWATTTAQCIHHFFDPAADLPGIPYRRRRRFEVRRMKYTRRTGDPQVLQKPGGLPSIFSELGEDSSYHFVKELSELDHFDPALPSGSRSLEFLELYALDLFAHWNYHDPGAVADAVARVDDFLARAHALCRMRDAGFMLIVDHGQDPVRRRIDLERHLRRSGVPKGEYNYLLEVASARFWFHTGRARTAITRLLRSLDHVNVRTREEMFDLNIRFEDPAFGELYAITDPGTIYFPHDFHQPLANVYMALTHEGQRRRLLDPVHQGYHGHLPHHPSERGYCVLSDDVTGEFVPTTAEAQLIDLAPTILDYLDRPVPPTMRGRQLFEPVPAAEVARVAAGYGSF